MKKRQLILAHMTAAMAVCGILNVSTPASAVEINDLFVFGDSYSDMGSYVKLTNPNGSTAVQYLANNFGITMTTSHNANPGTDGVNFAESGAKVDAHGAGQPRSLTQQVGEFQAYVASGTVQFNPATTLFFLSGGLNDHTTNPATIDAATAAQVATLYSLGARIFDIALLPSMIPAFTNSATTQNPGYTALVPLLRTLYPDAVFQLSNWGPDYDEILQNPSKYGITNTTTACQGPPVCSDPDKYFYYVNSHPSDVVHHLVGNELYQEVLGMDSPAIASAVPEPSTWAMLVLGFAGVGLAGYRRQRKQVVRFA